MIVSVIAHWCGMFKKSTFAVLAETVANCQARCATTRDHIVIFFLELVALDDCRKPMLGRIRVHQSKFGEKKREELHGVGHWQQVQVMATPTFYH